MKPLIFSFVLIVVLVFLGALSVAVFREKEKEEPVHLHASFIVVKHDEIMDFSSLRYMKIAACSDHSSTELSPEEEQLEKAHLHDKIGNVVHVHRAHATWGDLFTNIEFELSDPVGFIDGEKVDDILLEEIKPYDRIVIFDNSLQNIEEYIDSVPTIERIKEVESMSENCSA